MDKVLAHFKSKPDSFYSDKTVASASLVYLIELIIAIVIVVILTTIGLLVSIAPVNPMPFNNGPRLKSLARKLRTDASQLLNPAGDCHFQ